MILYVIPGAMMSTVIGSWLDLQYQSWIAHRLSLKTKDTAVATPKIKVPLSHHWGYLGYLFLLVDYWLLITLGVSHSTMKAVKSVPAQFLRILCLKFEASSVAEFYIKIILLISVKTINYFPVLVQCSCVFVYACKHIMNVFKSMTS